MENGGTFIISGIEEVIIYQIFSFHNGRNILQNGEMDSLMLSKHLRLHQKMEVVKKYIFL